MILSLKGKKNKQTSGCWILQHQIFNDRVTCETLNEKGQFGEIKVINNQRRRLKAGEEYAFKLYDESVRIVLNVKYISCTTRNIFKMI